MILLALALSVAAAAPEKPEVSKEDVAFIQQFVPVAVGALQAYAEGDKATAQMLVARGRAMGFDRHLQRDVGLVPICVPGFREMCLAELWLRLLETVEPSLDFS